jgi:hypothetical protein
MTDNLGPGVSRVLQSDGTQYIETIWQQGKPPCDSDLNLLQTLASDATRIAVLRGMPSGFLGNETNSSAAFLTNSTWSNWFKFGPQRTGEQQAIMWANVNGWVVPVTGTRTGTPPGSPNDVDTTNIIALDPPPANSGDNRIDFVFLEVWKARIQPNPSTTNKPAASAIFKYGNVEGGYSFLPDDLIDPALGFETNQRVQVQYRLRVVKGLIGLSNSPDGFDQTSVKAQGAAITPTSFAFTNMRQALGDPGLWRAGDGTQNALGTVDGYSYAIPLAAVFRRNSIVWNGNPSQNLNGGFNRNPTAIDRTGIKTFSTVPTLAGNITALATTATLVSATNLPLPASPATPVTIQIGDEIMTYASITGTTLNTLNRGQNGTVAEAHKAGTVVRVISGRPDGLFSDQIAATDIYDLRHLVNVNGAEYETLLKGSLDKLLRGQLRANWKRSGAGPQGTFVHYQDAIQAAAVALGVTQLDAPDNIRMVFSDTATVQPIECIAAPSAGPAGPAPVNINVNWSLQLTVQTTNQTVGNQFNTGDNIVIPVNQIKTGLQAGATDQVRWLNDSVSGAVQLRLDGETGDLDPSMYTVTPAVPGPNDDLTITFTSNFPTQDNSVVTSPRLLHIRVHAVYGPGRGLSRRPDSLHNVTFVNPSSDLLIQQSGIPLSNKSARVAWAPLWSKYRSTPFNNLLPVTSEIYADLGSKSVIITPFRRVDFVAPQGSLTIDGNAANPNPTPKAGSATSGTTSSANSNVLNVPSTGTSAIGDTLIIASGPGTGRYTITNVLANVSITVDRPVRAKGSVAVTFTVHSAQGLMPINKKDGTAKWGTTDPLGLFASQGSLDPVTKNFYVSLPRHLMPGWGEIRVPILTIDTISFGRGINFLCRDLGGAITTDQSNYIAYFGNGSSNEYSVFSQVNNAQVPLAYNTSGPGTGGSWAGMRFFTDTRGYGRKGLELPPFYGVARIFGVYQASDYIVNGSPFNTNRTIGGLGTAVNLLRQAMTQQDGPTIWIEIDDDGDSTFILNANAIDIAKAPTPILNFAAGTYVIEAAIFGFDRGSFDTASEFRLVLTRPLNTNAWIPPSNVSRSANTNIRVDAPTCVIPGPAEQATQILVNYSRTPYQGDAWGSQTTYSDIPYTPGPTTSQNAFQIVSTHLDQSALTRPNQKVLEVLASTSFTTDLGTGRYSADAVTNPLDFKDVAYEDPAVYPPTSNVDPRPKALPGNFVTADLTNIGTEYLGCTERLPMGALFRDKDFRGQSFTYLPMPLVYSDTAGNGPSTSLGRMKQIEQQEVPLDTASSGVGSPGDALVHVDGEQTPTNYAQLTNFRVYRGGSVFTANGSHPGGSVVLQNQPSIAQTNHVNVLQGRAMLVRNTVTSVGANEVSAGDELMLLIITTAQRPAPSVTSPGTVRIGTNGDGEGYSAADLYRIDGHPIVRNNVRMLIDPATILLAGQS